MSALPLNVKTLRQAAGLSVRELAAKAGLGSSTVHQVETGKRAKPRDDVVGALADALGTTVEALYSEPGVPGELRAGLDPAAATAEINGLLQPPALDIGVCRVCGCTDDRACPGGCSLVEPDLCSACRDKAAAAGAEGDAAGDNRWPIVWLRHDQLVPNLQQPRRFFDEAELAALADNIADVGVLQNLVANPGAGQIEQGDLEAFAAYVADIGAGRLDVGGERFVINAGERRWRAIGLLVQRGRWNAGAANIPVQLRPAGRGANSARALALIENLQRVALSPSEESTAFQQLLDDDWSVADIAGALRKTPRFVQQRLQLRDLCPSARDALDDGTIGPAIAIILARQTPADQMRALQLLGRDEIANTEDAFKALFAKSRGPGRPKEDGAQLDLVDAAAPPAPPADADPMAIPGFLRRDPQQPPGRVKRLRALVAAKPLLALQLLAVSLLMTDVDPVLVPAIAPNGRHRRVAERDGLETEIHNGMVPLWDKYFPKRARGEGGNRWPVDLLGQVQVLPQRKLVELIGELVALRIGGFEPLDWSGRSMAHAILKAYKDSPVGKKPRRVKVKQTRRLTRGKA